MIIYSLFFDNDDGMCNRSSLESKLKMMLSRVDEGKPLPTLTTVVEFASLNLSQW